MNVHSKVYFKNDYASGAGDFILLCNDLVHFIYIYYCLQRKSIMLTWPPVHAAYEAGKMAAHSVAAAQLCFCSVYVLFQVLCTFFWANNIYSRHDLLKIRVCYVAHKREYVEKVVDFWFLGVHLEEDLNSGVNRCWKKAQQRLNFLRGSSEKQHLPETVGVLLFCICVWYSSSTVT